MKLLEEAESILQSTGGLFDVTVYPLMQLWGFPAGDYRVPTQEEISSTLSLVDAAQIQIEGAQVTLGEGSRWIWAVSPRAMPPTGSWELYREYGVTSGMVSGRQYRDPGDETGRDRLENRNSESGDYVRIRKRD